MNLVYCYDAYCGWCYGFSPVIKKIAEEYKGILPVEVLSGGMILPETPQPIAKTAPFIQQAYKQVETYTGITFGQEYLWHIFHPDESDWFPNSLKPAIALCVIKANCPEYSVAFACDVQYALHFEGRDLTDDEAYRHLLPRYGLDETVFYESLHSEIFEEKARYDFALVRQLQVSSFPTLLLQVSENKFYLMAKGYTDFAALDQRLEATLKDVGHS